VLDSLLLVVELLVPLIQFVEVERQLVVEQEFDQEQPLDMEHI
jgi:hypothetical protein